jgi:hypothetical protein
MKTIPSLLAMAVAGCAAAGAPRVDVAIRADQTATVVFTNGGDRPVPVTGIRGSMIYWMSEVQPDGSVAGRVAAPGFWIARLEGPHVVEPGRSLELKIPDYRPPRGTETVTVSVECEVDGVPVAAKAVVKGPGAGAR